MTENRSESDSGTKRRTLLATSGVGLSTSLVGCLHRGGFGRREDETITPSAATATAPPNECGPAALSLSELLGDESGEESRCPDGARPSVAIENERTEDVTAAVDITKDGALTESYTLESGERVIEPRAFHATESGLFRTAETRGTVRIEGEPEREVVWPARSCYRHAIAIVPDGLEIGWVEPLSGTGDVDHDCYAGDSALLRIYSLGTSRTIDVTIVDSCAETETTETFEVPESREESVVTPDLLTNGGVYEITVDVRNGPTKTHSFDEDCRGISVTVDEDGELRITTMSAL